MISLFGRLDTSNESNHMKCFQVNSGIDFHKWEVDNDFQTSISVSHASFFLNGEKERHFLLYLNNSFEKDVTYMNFRPRNLLESCIPLKSISPLRQEVDCFSHAFRITKFGNLRIGCNYIFTICPSSNWIISPKIILQTQNVAAWYALCMPKHFNYW